MLATVIFFLALFRRGLVPSQSPIRELRTPGDRGSYAGIASSCAIRGCPYRKSVLASMGASATGMTHQIRALHRSGEQY